MKKKLIGIILVLMLVVICFSGCSSKIGSYNLHIHLYTSLEGNNSCNISISFGYEVILEEFHSTVDTRESDPAKIINLKKNWGEYVIQITEHDTNTSYDNVVELYQEISLIITFQDLPHPAKPVILMNSYEGEAEIE